MMASVNAGNEMLIDGATGTDADLPGVPMLENA